MGSYIVTKRDGTKVVRTSSSSGSFSEKPLSSSIPKKSFVTRRDEVIGRATITDLRTGKVIQQGYAGGPAPSSGPVVGKTYNVGNVFPEATLKAVDLNTGKTRTEIVNLNTNKVVSRSSGQLNREQLNRLKIQQIATAQQFQTGQKVKTINNKQNIQFAQIVKDVRAGKERALKQDLTGQQIKNIKYTGRLIRDAPKDITLALAEIAADILNLGKDSVIGSYKYGVSLSDRFYAGENNPLFNDVKALAKGTVSVASFIKNNPKKTVAIIGAASSTAGRSYMKAFVNNPVKTLTKTAVILFPGTIIKGVKGIGSGISKKVFSSVDDISRIPIAAKTEITFNRAKLLADVKKKQKVLDTISKSKIGTAKAKEIVKAQKTLEKVSKNLKKKKSRTLSGAEVKGLFRQFDALNKVEVKIIKQAKLYTPKRQIKIVKVPKPQLRKGKPTGKKKKKIIKIDVSKKKKEIDLTKKEPIKLSRKERARQLTKEAIEDQKRSAGLKKIIAEEKSLGNINFQTLRKGKRGSVVPIQVQTQRIRKGISQTNKSFRKSSSQLKRQINKLRPRYNQTIKKLNSKSSKVRKQGRKELSRLNKASKKIKANASKQSQNLKAYRKALGRLARLGVGTSYTIASLSEFKQASAIGQELKKINENIKDFEIPIPPPGGKTKIINIIKTPIKPPIKPREGKTPPSPPKLRGSRTSPPLSPKPPVKPKVTKFKLSLNTKLPRGQRLAFDYRIREKGRVKIIKAGLPLNKALKKATSGVDRSTSRSMELIIAGITRKKDITKPSAIKKFRLRKTRKVLKLVEKSKYAIDTSGEKRGLKLGKLLKPKKRKGKKRRNKKK